MAFGRVVGIPKPVVLGHTLSSFDLVLLAALAQHPGPHRYGQPARSRFGRALVACATTHPVACDGGRPCRWCASKMMAFVTSAAMAGLAGRLCSPSRRRWVTPDDFTADFSIFFLLDVVRAAPAGCGAGGGRGRVLPGPNCSPRCRSGAC